MLRLRDGVATARPDTLAVEEPLEIRVNGSSLSVTMRTPGDDFELAAGFLVSEGVIGARDDVVGIRYCDEGRPDPTYNLLDVTLAPHIVLPDLTRNFYVSSSCGVCGKDSLDAVRTATRWSVADDPLRVPAGLLAVLPDRLREGQAIFERTGGLHAAGLFTAEGEALVVREDVGRHNAVDKVTGARLLGGSPPAEACLVVSGRAGFELVQKAVTAGIGSLVAVGAPTSLAAHLAREAGLALFGFTKGERTVRYS